jgi:Zn-dependent M28 family amino/carboxypeptidase
MTKNISPTKIILVTIVGLLLSFQFTNAQKTVAPKSEIIEAIQLLDDLKTLSADDMQGRQFGTSGGVKARDFVEKRFKESGLVSFGNSYLQPFEITNRSGKKINGANVYGYIKGNKNPESYIIVTAHYDHLGVRNGEVFNGADDNASGVAAMFAMAKYFVENTPKNSIIFVAFDAEESGLQGARKFVEKMPVKKESVLLNVNMDMIAHNDVNELYASGTKHYPNLKPYLDTLAKLKDTKVKLILGHDQPNPPQDDWTSQSDHFVFHEAKIPFIYFGVEDHKDYHKATDEFQNINRKFYVNAVETILETVKIFDANLVKRNQ